MPSTHDFACHDPESGAVLACFAKRIGLVGILFLLGNLLRYPESGDGFLLSLGAVLLLLAGLLWKLAWSPNLVLEADRLVLRKWLRRYKVRYGDIAAIALQSGTTATGGFNRRTEDRPAETLHLKLRGRRLMDCGLSERTGSSVVDFIRSKTGLKETHLDNAEDLAQWKKSLAIA